MTTLRPLPRLRRASVRAQDEDTSHIGSTESRAMAAAPASETPGRGCPRDRIDCSGCSLVTCPSGRRSTLGKRVLCKQPRVRIPPSPPKSTKGPRASGGPSCFHRAPGIRGGASAASTGVPPSPASTPRSTPRQAEFVPSGGSAHSTRPPICRSDEAHSEALSARLCRQGRQAEALVEGGGTGVVRVHTQVQPAHSAAGQLLSLIHI